MVDELEESSRFLEDAETSVLVDLLYSPERLFPKGSEMRERCEKGETIAK